MKTIKSYGDFQVDNKNIRILGESFNGETLLCDAPDIFIVPKRIYNKYALTHFLFLNSKHNCKIIKV